MKALLVTGCAGFIGFHAARRWLAEGGTVIGCDNLNDYYDPVLKQSRLKLLQESSSFTFIAAALEDREAMHTMFAAYKPDVVLHLAAQAGVRHSLVDPYTYVDSNVTGFLNVLEGCRSYGTSHLLYGSSSSVYGANTTMPFSVSDRTDHPLSLYAATKKANELMAHSYSHLFRIQTIGLRFFTVYGPWGRPDMALFKFTKSIIAGEPITVYNEGRMKRDFTYIDDIVEGIMRLIRHAPNGNEKGKGNPLETKEENTPYQIYNIGSSRPVELMKYIEILEQALGRKAIVNLAPMQPGDAPETYADVESLQQVIDYQPRTPIEEGIPRFVEWYLSYYDKFQVK